jgi:hypothetical protein
MASQVKNTSTLGTKKGPAFQPGPEMHSALRRNVTAIKPPHSAPVYAAMGLTIFSTAAWNCALIGAKVSWVTLVATSLSFVVCAV